MIKHDAWRVWDLRIGYASSGMHDFIMDEIEVSPRGAMGLDSENNCGWSAIDDVLYNQWAEKEQSNE